MMEKMSVAALPFTPCLECPETRAAIHRNTWPTSPEWAFAFKVHQYELIRGNLLDNQWVTVGRYMHHQPDFGRYAYIRQQ